MSRRTVVLLATIPSLLLFLATIIHPPRLADEYAETWRNLHFALIFVFPLVGISPWVIARGAGRFYGWVAGFFGYGFATAYTALDILAGVGGGALVLNDMRDATGPLFAIAKILEQLGGSSLVLACVAAGVAAFRLARWWAVPGAIVAVVGAILLLQFHIYPVRGTLATGALLVGFALLAYAITRRATMRPQPAAVIAEAS